MLSLCSHKLYFLSSLICVPLTIATIFFSSFWSSSMNTLPEESQIRLYYTSQEELNGQNYACGIKFGSSYDLKITSRFPTLSPFKNLISMRCTNSLTFNNCTLCPHCIYVFCIYLRTDSNLCHLQHKLVGFYSRDVKCLQRGTDWAYK